MLKFYFKRFVIYLEQYTCFLFIFNFLFYKLNDYISPKSDILDIGGNKGNISKFINNYNTYTLIEPINFARSKNNIIIYNMKFEDFIEKQKYDCIIFFAVHNYIKLSPCQIFNKINTLLKKNGVLLIKSHKLPDQKYMEIIKIFNNKYQILYKKKYFYCIKRELIYFKKL